MIAARPCSKPGCTQPSVATLTFNYHDSMAVLGPLATSPEPHTYDLCEGHAMNLTVPVGWQIVRLQTTYEPAPPSSDDLLALVDAVRAAARSEAAARTLDPAQPGEVERPRPAAPVTQERATYATVTQLRPKNSDGAPSREADAQPGAASSQKDEDEHATGPTHPHSPSRPAVARPGSRQAGPPASAAQFVASELGPFAQPRPAYREESASGENPDGEQPR